MPNSPAWLLMVAPLLAAFCGCGANLQPVRGKVTLPSGQAAAGSQVVFEGEQEGNVVSARGDVQADGTFQMSTHQPGDGVPVGKYRVQVNPPPMVDAEARSVAPFNPKYSSFDTSGLQFEVKPGAGELSIQLTK
jgi:hypothetical protein